jgi:protein-disulfide isomerase
MNTEKKSKRQERREKLMQEQRRNRLIVIGGVAVVALFVILAFAVPAIQKAAQPPATPAPVVAIDPGTHPNPKDNSMGNPDAPITIEEFSDFQCPYCSQFHQTTEPQLRQYFIDPGKVRFIYRTMGNFVSDNIARQGGPTSTESQDAALAAYCAGDQNKFWEMHAALFGNAVGENAGSFTPERLKLIAEKAGLNMDQFNSCYDSGKFRDRVQQDGQAGRDAGVTGTPSFLITYTVNGQKKSELIEGAQPFATFQQKLEAILTQVGTK